MYFNYSVKALTWHKSAKCLLMLIFAAVHTFLKRRKYVNGDGFMYSMHIILRGGVAQ